MSRRQRRARKDADKSFSAAVQQTQRTKLEQDKPEALNAIKLQRTEELLEGLSQKRNRFLFYCPDVPHPVGLVYMIYQHAKALQKLGFAAEIIHEVSGYKPNWIFEFEQRYGDIKRHYLTSKTKKTKGSFKFRPTDTVIVPDAFFSVMQHFHEVQQVQKVVLIASYGGMATIEPGVSWQHLGFHDAIGVSDKVIEDYRNLYPGITYHKAGYWIDQQIFAKPNDKEKQPVIAFSCRNREDAQRIINIFYNRYPFLDMFQFDIVKRKTQKQYANCLQNSAILVLCDEKSACPQWPLESLACNTPVIAIGGRGYAQFADHPDVTLLDTNDDFYVAEVLAQFCLRWLEIPHMGYEVNKAILDQYAEEGFRGDIKVAYQALHENVVKRFAALKNTLVKQAQ